MSLLEKNIVAAKELYIDSDLYLINSSTLDTVNTTVEEVLDYLESNKRTAPIEYINKMVNSNTICEELNSYIFSEEPSKTKIKKLISLTNPQTKLLDDSAETLELNIYLINQWTGIYEMYTVQQVLGYIGKSKGISYLNDLVLNKSRYCLALKSYIYFEKPTKDDVLNVLKFHKTNDEIYLKYKDTPYYISQYGRVKQYSTNIEIDAKYILPIYLENNKHENRVAIKLNIDNNIKYVSLSKIVGHLFVINDNIKDYRHLHFKDGNPLNVSYYNLIWRKQTNIDNLVDNDSNCSNENELCLDTPLYLVNRVTLDIVKLKAVETLKYLKSLKGISSLNYINSIVNKNVPCSTLKSYVFLKEPSRMELKDLIKLSTPDIKLLIHEAGVYDKQIYTVNQWSGIVESFTVRQVLSYLGQYKTIDYINDLIVNNNRYCPAIKSYIFYDKPTAFDIKLVIGHHVIPDETFIQYQDTPYYISQYGRVKSYQLKISFRGDFLVPSLKQKNQNESYPVVRFRIDGKKVLISIAKMVALLFVENEDPKNNRNLYYKDGNPLNYIYSNLAWKQQPNTNFNFNDDRLLPLNDNSLTIDVFLVNRFTGAIKTVSVYNLLESLNKPKDIDYINRTISKDNRFIKELNSYIFIDKPRSFDIRNILQTNILVDEKFVQYKDTNYLLSQYGRIKALITTNGEQKELFITPTTKWSAKKGLYAIALLDINGKRVTTDIAEMVIETFLSDEEPQVNQSICFNDGDSLNYIASNLYWGVSNKLIFTEQNFETILATDKSLYQSVYLVNKWTGITEQIIIKDILESIGDNFTIDKLNRTAQFNNRYIKQLESYIFTSKPSPADVRMILKHHHPADEIFIKYEDSNYYISQYGRAISFAQGVSSQPTYLIPRMKDYARGNRKGRLVIVLKMDDTKKELSLARLVAELFVDNDNPDKNTHIQYKDQNTKNIVYSNLSWITASESRKPADNTDIGLVSNDSKMLQNYFSLIESNSLKFFKYSSSKTITDDARSISNFNKNNAISFSEA